VERRRRCAARGGGSSSVLVVDDEKVLQEHNLERDGESGMIGKMKCAMIAMELSVIRGATIE
jgi:hypothetical protein